MICSRYGYHRDSTALSTVLQLAYARTVVVRDVDATLAGYHGLGLNDVALLLELHSAADGRLRRLDLADRLGITPSGVARQLAPLERRGLVGTRVASRRCTPGDRRPDRSRCAHRRRRVAHRR